MINPDDLNLIDPDLLPPQIRQLVQIIGLPDTFKLLEARGGTLLRVPVKPEGTIMQGMISHEAATRLCEAWGNRVISLPKADKVTKQLRNIAIYQSRKTMSLTQVAQKFDLTRRHIINLSHNNDDNPSMDLFDSPPLDNKSHS